MGKAQRLQKLSDIALVIVDAEAGRDHAAQVDAPPPNDAVGFQVRAAFDDPRQFLQLRGRQPPLGPICPLVEKPVRALLVEPVSPIAQGLAIHPADFGRLAPIHPVPNRRQRQQSSALVGVLRALRQKPKLVSRIVLA